MSKRTILMLHGLGGDRSSMEPLAEYCRRRLVDSQFFAIEGPINFGTDTDRMLGWFDSPRDHERSLDGPDRPTLHGITKSVALIHTEIRRLVNQGSDTKSIHLLGHSQGGAIALAAGLTFPERLGSVCTIAGYLALTPEMTVLAKGTQYFLHHAEGDDNVSVRWAHYAQDFIRGIGEPCELTCWNIDRNPHSIHVDQLDSLCTAISDAE